MSEYARQESIEFELRHAPKPVPGKIRKMVEEKYDNWINQQEEKP